MLLEHYGWMSIRVKNLGGKLMMRRIILILIVCLLPSLSTADTFFLDNATTVGVDEEHSSVISELIRISFGEIAKGKDRLVDTKSEAQYVLKPQIINLDGAYIVNIEKLSNDTVVYSSRIKAYELSEMDVKIHRVVRSLFEEGSPDPNVGEVTKPEIEEKVHRKETVKRTSIAFGPSWGVNLNTENVMVNLSIGKLWEVNPSSSIRMFWEGNWTKEESEYAYLTNVGLGLSYFLTQEDRAPFIMFDLGYGLAGVNDDSDWDGDETLSGFVLGVGCGYTFFRTSLANFEISLRYQALFDSDAEKVPGTVGLKIGVLF